MKRMVTLMLMVTVCGSLMAQVNLSVTYRPPNQMPDWATGVAGVVDTLAVPEDAEVWRLVDDHEIIYAGDNEIYHRHKVVQVVLRQGGAQAASYYAAQGDQDESQVVKLTGWHEPKVGNPERITMDDLVLQGTSRPDLLTRDTAMVGYFTDVRKGSVIAFDVVIKSKTMMGPLLAVNVIGPFPTRSFSVTAKRKSEVLDDVAPEEDQHLLKKVTPYNLKAWELDGLVAGASVMIENIPAYRQEPHAADYSLFYPFIYVSFVDPNRPWQYQSWDTFAAWYFDRFFEAVGKGMKTPATPGAVVLDQIQILAEDMKKITYKQVYLSSGRGWTPSPGKRVRQRAWGDCKDMVSCVADQGIGMKLRVLPVLANIGPGPYTSAKHQPMSAFNHLIAAVELNQTLGLPAEVEVGGKRFLIMDPTSPHTRLGYLPGHYQGRELLICHEGGGYWVAVPDKALEQGALTLTLRGSMDADLVVRGELEVVEVGDSAGMRRVISGAGDRDLEYQLRRVLGFSGLVDLQLISRRIDTSGRALSKWSIRWPAFMRNDAGGLRLSNVVLPLIRDDILGPGSRRTNPIQYPELSGLTWDIQLDTPVKLTPGIAEKSWKGEYQTYSWSADTHNGLALNVTLDLQGAVFDRAQLKKGVLAWREFGKAYRRFYLFESLFTGEGCLRLRGKPLGETSR